MIKIDLAQKSRDYMKALSDRNKMRFNIIKQIRQGLYMAGSQNVKETRRLMSDEPKTGRWYLYKGRRYRASAPREAPAIRSKALYKSVSYKVTGAEQMEFGDQKEYGKYLELGTRNMAPRTHLIRTVIRREQINRRLILHHDIKRIVR